VSTVPKYHDNKISSEERLQKDSSEYVTDIPKAAQSGVGLDDVKMAHVGI